MRNLLLILTSKIRMISEVSTSEAAAKAVAA
nr:MAG TPA: hypothetical protein [Caudoviricetes sp.]DAY39319.1 MAG TPA: hypothetical protein [Caudoviricetes sp.]